MIKFDVSRMEPLASMPKAILNKRIARSMPQKAENVTNVVDVNKKTFVDKFRSLIGLRTKLKPNSFFAVEQSPEDVFPQSEEALSLSKKYIEKSFISDKEELIDGFKDTGYWSGIDKTGKIIDIENEIITVDRKHDIYLNKVIEYAKQKTVEMPKRDKLNFIYDLVRDLGGSTRVSRVQSKDLSKSYKGKEILLGTAFSNEATSSMHKAILFKILSDEVGLKANLNRGHHIGVHYSGPFAWNVVDLNDGRKIFVDTQKGLRADMDTKNQYKQFRMGFYLN